MHFLRDVPKILGDERQLTKRVAHGVEQRAAGAGHPAAVNGGGLAGRDFPIRRETAEVIDPNDVGETKRRAEPRNPPAEVRVTQYVPAIKRIAPPLPGGAEVIGRNSGDDRRLAAFVELEDLAIGPDVGAVAGNVDGDVAHDADAARVGGLAHRRPLREEEPLHVFMKPDLVRKLATRIGQRIAAARGDVSRPRRPGLSAVLLLERGVERPVGKPGIVVDERGQRLALFVRGMLGEMLERLAKQHLLECMDAIEFDVIRGERGNIVERIVRQQSALDETLR